LFNGTGEQEKGGEHNNHQIRLFDQETCPDVGLDLRKNELHHHAKLRYQLTTKHAKPTAPRLSVSKG